MLSRLGLGTAQFGSHYGVSNGKGAPAESEIADILAATQEAGIGYIDTAHGYPQAEELIGRYLQLGHGLKIVTKTPPIGEGVIEAAHKARMLDALSTSLDRLKIDKVHGLLVHHVNDLHKRGREYLVEALQEARARGLVNRVGVSIYDVAQLESMEMIFDAGIVQFPYNVFDSRVVTSDVFRRLKGAGVEMHARSAFLQGLLLMERSQLPEYFAPVRNELSQLHAEWAAAGVSRLSGCLGFVLRNPDVDALMVGVNSLAEFEGVREAIAEAAHGDFRIAGRFEPDVEFVDPSRWPSFAR